ncbi:MAG: ribosome maturation factor RimM [Bacteroidaceae bacterium]
MIKQEDVVKIGRITKSRGIQGEVELQFTDDAFDRGEVEYLVCMMDGILVPFFWEEFRYKNEHIAIFKFEDFYNEDDAQKLVGVDVYYPLSYLKERTDRPASWTYFKGFHIIDAEAGDLGVVDSVDESSANILFYIHRADDSELLIPFHPELLVASDEKTRTLTVKLPEGLLTLND